jgi:hypothetical protein
MISAKPQGQPEVGEIQWHLLMQDCHVIGV